MFCFTAIVKETDPALMRRCLLSVRPVCSCWCISDTGSAPEVLAVVQEVLGDLPGVLRKDRWVDFATNRNIALREAQKIALANGTDYVLTIDADEEIVLPEGLDASGLKLDGYNAWFRLEAHDNTWQRKLLMRADKPWAFAGVMDEQPYCPGATVGLVQDLRVLSHHDSLRNQQSAAKKYLADAAVLKRHLRTNKTDSRAWFYYARRLAAGGKLWQAIDAYRVRLTLGDGDNPEELFHSLYQIGALKEMLGYHWHDVIRAYQDAVNERPHRAEPLWAIAVLYGNAKEHPLAEIFARRASALQIPLDGLFVQRSIYEWRAADALAAALAEQGKFDEARMVLERLQKRPELPDAERPRVAQNIDMIKAAA